MDNVAVGDEGGIAVELSVSPILDRIVGRFPKEDLAAEVVFHLCSETGGVCGGGFLGVCVMRCVL